MFPSIFTFTLAAAAIASPTKPNRMGKRASAQTFVAPAPNPSSTSANYVGKNNNTLPASRTNTGPGFGRFIQIWLENTDFNDAMSTTSFKELAKQGILLNGYHAVTHPSEPNYMAAAGGDFWGLGDDAYHDVPDSIYSIVDILEDGGVTWATYQENLPFDGDVEYSFASTNYVDPDQPDYAYYYRKHNPPVFYNRTANNPARRARIRNFNDFAVDLGANVLPDWVFITPNMVNDAHDTDIDYGSDWLAYWLLPLLKDKRFNNDDTLILLTFDENETFGINNQIAAILLGNAVPKNLKGTADNTYYTHYSAISTVQANWRLKGLGRGDMNKTMNNVYSFVADRVGWVNNHISGSKIPLTNLTTTIPGPLNDFGLTTAWPVKPPFWNGISAGGKGVIGWCD